MKYVVLMNNGYMNSFEKYGDAVELREQLEKRFPKARIEIQTVE